MDKENSSKNEYYWNLEKCVSCNADTPTLKELLNRRKDNHVTSIIISTTNKKDLFKGNISDIPEELLNLPIFEWNKQDGSYITIE